MENTINDFKKWAKMHPNFITPNIIKVIQVDNSFIELSEGLRFDRNTFIFGVSKIDYINNDFKTDIDSEFNKPFSSKRLAENHFKNVVIKLKSQINKHHFII